MELRHAFADSLADVMDAAIDMEQKKVGNQLFLTRFEIWPMEASLLSGQRDGLSSSAVLGSSPTLTTTWICFTVNPSSNPRPRL